VADWTPIQDDPFFQIAAVLLVAAAAAAVATWLRQPLIVAFIVVGVVVGPSVLGVVEAGEELELLAQIGIAILLFLVGLKLDLRLIRTVGPVALAAGLGQVVFTSVIGFGIALALGLDAVTALYVAVALTFSSTIIIVKLLTDKREIDDLYGRIAVGFLIVQDIVVIIVMIVIAALGGAEGETGLASRLLEVALYGVALAAALAAAMRWLLTPLLHRLARSRELLVLSAIAWAVSLSAVAEAIGLSGEVGAFLAGISLASTPYREALGARLVSLRDFLLLFFFINLGAGIDLGLVGGQVGAALALSAFVLVGNPLIVLVILGVMGYRAGVGFRAGLTVAQISEFSLILAALGLALGHIDDEALGLITTVGLVTIALSTYMILNADRLYERLAPFLKVFERASPTAGERLTPGVGGVAPRVVVFGLGRYGGEIVEGLREGRVPVLGVDYDPGALAGWSRRGVPVFYGDLEDPELPGVLPLHEAEWVVSTVRRLDDNLALLHALRDHGYRGSVVLAAQTREDAEVLERAGADLTVVPYADAAREVVAALGR
jgi:Kef-type K+ transport system membrane component KefB